MNHLILSNLAGFGRRLARGTFDPIIINGETISHTVRDLGVYIESSINLTVHFPRLTTRTCFFKFVNFGLSARLLNYRIFANLARWLWLLSIIATDFLVRKPCKVSPQSVILASQKRTVPHWLVISANNCVQDLRACSPMSSWICFNPIWYFTPVSAIPGTHNRTSQIGCGGHVKIFRPRSQTLTIGSWAFCYLLPFCMELPPGSIFVIPVLALVTLRWKLKAFLFSPSAYLSVHQMLIIVFMFVNSQRLLFETIFNSFLIIIITNNNNNINDI